MQGTTDIVLVTASYCVAVSAAYAALDLGVRVAFFEGRRRWFWLLAGAAAMGTGVGAAFFVGLKSLQLPMVASFDPLITLATWLAACAASLAALRVIARGKLSNGSIATGGVLLGLGIFITFGCGIAAMRLNPAAIFSAPLMVLSALVGIVGATASLLIAFRLHTLPDRRVTAGRLASALIMGAAICGQHYLGFAATTLADNAVPASDNSLVISLMGLPIAVLTCIMLAITVFLSVADTRLVAERRRVARARAEAERVHHLAYYDGVTALPNRSLFTEKLLKQLVSAHNVSGPQMPVGLVYAELPTYRNLVEQLGQDRLNRILKTLAGQLSRQLRTGDVLARLSSDGFILMIREQDSYTTQAVRSAFSAQLSTPITDDGESFRFGWAIGSSRYPDNGNSTQGLIRAAMNTQHHIGAEAATLAISTLPRYALAS